MFESGGSAAEVLAALHDLVSDLIDLKLTPLAGEDVLALLQGLEVERRRLAVVDHALIAEVDTRGLAGERGCASTARLLRPLLRIGVGEAGARTRAATELGPRRGLTGEPLPPVYPRVAAACTAGELSAAQARIITTTVDGLPDAVQVEHDDAVQEFLIEQASRFDPDQLGQLARRLSDTLDPDGTLADERHRDRRRQLTVHRRPDGSARLDAELTAACAEALLTVLDATARPAPATDGAPDPRTPGQRRHDGLLDGLLTLLRTAELPPTGGVATTIILTMTADPLQRHLDGLPAGTVATGHGTHLSVAQMLRLAADARVIPAVFGSAKEGVAYGSTHRIFTETQRLAMIARDQGCSFPGCETSPFWCQAHHAPDHLLSGRTTIDEGTLVCGYHHREHPRLGWECVLIDRRPHWRPPAWIDPARRPVRNELHDPQPAGRPD